MLPDDYKNDIIMEIIFNLREHFSGKLPFETNSPGTRIAYVLCLNIGLQNHQPSMLWTILCDEIIVSRQTSSICGLWDKHLRKLFTLLHLLGPFEYIADCSRLYSELFNSQQIIYKKVVVVTINNNILIASIISSADFGTE
jgi:hypothetical protein